MAEHETKAVKMSHAWVAECVCGWLGADQGGEARAAKEAAEHEHEPSEPQVVPWTPSAIRSQGGLRAGTANADAEASGGRKAEALQRPRGHPFDAVQNTTIRRREVSARR